MLLTPPALGMFSGSLVNAALTRHWSPLMKSTVWLAPALIPQTSPKRTSFSNSTFAIPAV